MVDARACKTDIGVDGANGIDSEVDDERAKRERERDTTRGRFDSKDNSKQLDRTSILDEDFGSFKTKSKTCAG